MSQARDGCEPGARGLEAGRRGRRASACTESDRRTATRAPPAGLVFGLFFDLVFGSRAGHGDPAWSGPGSGVTGCVLCVCVRARGGMWAVSSGGGGHRMRALSRTSGKLVAAMTTMPSVDLKPSMSASSCPPPNTRFTSLLYIRIYIRRLEPVHVRQQLPPPPPQSAPVPFSARSLTGNRLRSPAVHGHRRLPRPQANRTTARNPCPSESAGRRREGWERGCSARPHRAAQLLMCGPNENLAGLHRAAVYPSRRRRQRTRCMPHRHAREASIRYAPTPASGALLT